MIEPSNVYQQQIKEMFGKKTNSEFEYIFKLAELLLFQNFKSSDSFKLYSLLGLENFAKVVNYIDGREVRLPTKKELEESLIAAIIYYEKEIKNLSWKEIKQKYPEFDITSVKYSYRIKNLNDTMRQKINDYFGVKNEEC